MGKNEKTIFKFGFKFEKIEMCHENLKWNNWNFSFLILIFFLFEIWNENFYLIFLKICLTISPNGNEKAIEMKKLYISFMPPR
jgi:hypothetical protein